MVFYYAAGLESHGGLMGDIAAELMVEKMDTVAWRRRKEDFYIEYKSESDFSLTKLLHFF
jgi:orotate phosphoribosyltransferase-like protein